MIWGMFCEISSNCRESIESLPTVMLELFICPSDLTDIWDHPWRMGRQHPSSVCSLSWTVLHLSCCVETMYGDLAWDYLQGQGHLGWKWEKWCQLTNAPQKDHSCRQAVKYHSFIWEKALPVLSGQENSTNKTRQSDGLNNETVVISDLFFSEF